MVNLARVPYGFAKRYGILVDQDSGGPIIRHRHNTPGHALLELRRLLRTPVRYAEISDGEFDHHLQRNYESGDHDAERMMEDLGDEMNLDRIAQQLPEPEDLLESADDAPIIRLINALLTEAIKENASDIHIDAFEHRLLVRFRIDGVLRETLQPPKALAPLLVSRVKVMAHLDIAEKRLPQDGRISLRVAGRPVDVRVSTLPSGHGERVVLRLLDKQEGRLDLRRLGMSPPTEQRLVNLLNQPHGILLVTGPTGSGKTTTLYGALNLLNDKRRNIMTVEDPIEYYLDGISQTQVNPKVDMTFARGLRAILRQDPDVVMVGEIRDLETAEIAVQASLTGHMVISTLHTNSAIGAITRLRDMGVEPFLLASSLIGVMAQRLMRLLCSECREKRPATPQDLLLLGIDAEKPIFIYQPTGCKTCNFSGYRGRVGIFELISIDQSLQNKVHDGCSESELEKDARQHAPSIREDGVRRVLDGATSLEELVRITRES